MIRTDNWSFGTDKPTTGDGWLSAISTMGSAILAGAVAALVLGIQNSHQRRLHDDQIRAASEESRRAREIAAAAELAAYLDTRWQLFRGSEDIERKLPELEFTARDTRTLRRLVNIWVSQLNTEALQSAQVSRVQIRDSVIKFAEAIHWGAKHFNSANVPSELIKIVGDPAKLANQGHYMLSVVADTAPRLTTESPQFNAQFLTQVTKNARSMPVIAFFVPVWDPDKDDDREIL